MLVFMDCEAFGPCPSLGKLTEFGAVTCPSRATFHGVLLKTRPSPDNPAIPEPLPDDLQGWPHDVTYETVLRDTFTDFEQWLRGVGGGGRHTMVSDNPAFDWQWINDGFWRTLGRNPLGFSARRLGDFYAGLRGDFGKANEWKHLRVTRHDHNPVNDAMGNLEAYERMLTGAR